MRIVALTVFMLLLLGLLAPVVVARPAGDASAPRSAHADDLRPGDDGAALHPAADGALLRQAADSACVVEADKTAGPAEVVLGDTVAITLTVRATCPPVSPPRVVFVAEATGTAIDRGAAEAFFRLIGSELPPGTGFGLVVFDVAGGVVCPIGDDPTATGTCVDARPGMTLADAVGEAFALFALAREGEERWYEGLVAATDFSGTLECQPILDAAAEAHSERIDLSTLCLGPGCDRQCLTRVATTPRHYYEAATLGDLPSVGHDLRDDLIETIDARAATPLRFEITDQLPPNMTYRRGTARPEPSMTSPTRDEFTWSLEAASGETVSASLVVEPLDVGTFPTNLWAIGGLTDQLGQTGAFTFPAPQVRVLAPPPPVWSAYVPVAEAGRR